MLKRSEKFGSLFRSKQNMSDAVTPKSGVTPVPSRDDLCTRSLSFKNLVTQPASHLKSVTQSDNDLFHVASQSKCDDIRVTQCYSVTTGKVSTLMRSPSLSTMSSHSSASFNGDGDDESDFFPTKNSATGRDAIKHRFPSSLTSGPSKLECLSLARLTGAYPSVGKVPRAETSFLFI